MLFWLLVGLDIFGLIGLIFRSLIAGEIILIIGLILLIKGFIFAVGGDKISWVDVLCGLYLMSIAFGFSFWLLSFIFIVYLVQKVVVSLFSL